MLMFGQRAWWWIPVGDTTLIHLGDETVEQILLTYDDLFPRG